MKAANSVAAVPFLALAVIPSSPDLGTTEARCRAQESGPALLVTVAGLKDRKGRLKLEVYPDNDHDFLQDDNVLVSHGKVFRRVETAVPQTDPVELCVRVPAPGSYAVSLLHDRDGNRKFGWMVDGVGFAGNPRLGWGKPHARSASVDAGSGLTRLTIVLNYRSGLGVAPLKTKAGQ